MTIRHHPAPSTPPPKGAPASVPIGETMSNLATPPDSRRRIFLNGSRARSGHPTRNDAQRNRQAAQKAQRQAETRQATKQISLWVFFSITFGVSWGLGLLAVFFQERIEALTGPIGLTNPLFMLVVYSPAIAGIGLVARHHGRQGLRGYFRRLLMWRMPRAWWVYLVLGMPAVFYLGALVKGESFDPFPFSAWYAVLPALGLTMILGPMEEFGWRGVALPLLQRKMAPIWAGLLLGTLWATWHLPAFLLEGTPQSEWSFAAFFVGLVAVELALTPMFDAARGSLLIPMLYHFQLNGPVWPDAQPFDSYIFIVVAVVVVVLNRRKMFTRAGAPTGLFAPGEDPPGAEHSTVG